MVGGCGHQLRQSRRPGSCRDPTAASRGERETLRSGHGDVRRSGVPRGPRPGRPAPRSAAGWSRSSRAARTSTLGGRLLALETCGRPPAPLRRDPRRAGRPAPAGRAAAGDRRVAGDGRSRPGRRRSTSPAGGRRTGRAAPSRPVTSPAASPGWDAFVARAARPRPRAHPGRRRPAGRAAARAGRPRPTCATRSPRRSPATRPPARPGSAPSCCGTPPPVTASRPRWRWPTRWPGTAPADALTRALPALLAVGHTSGAALARGLLLAAETLAAPARPRRQEQRA